MDVRLDLFAEEVVQVAALLHALIAQFVDVLGVILSWKVVVDYSRVEPIQVAFKFLLAQVAIVDLRAKGFDFVHHSVVERLMIELEVLAKVAQQVRRNGFGFQVHRASRHVQAVLFEVGDLLVVIRQHPMHFVELYLHLLPQAVEVVLWTFHVRTSHLLVADKGLTLRSEGVGEGKALDAALEGGFLLISTQLPLAI